MKNVSRSVGGSVLDKKFDWKTVLLIGFSFVFVPLWFPFWLCKQVCFGFEWVADRVVDWYEE